MERVSDIGKFCDGPFMSVPLVLRTIGGVLYDGDVVADYCSGGKDDRPGQRIVMFNMTACVDPDQVRTPTMLSNLYPEPARRRAASLIVSAGFRLSPSGTL